MFKRVVIELIKDIMAIKGIFFDLFKLSFLL